MRRAWWLVLGGLALTLAMGCNGAADADAELNRILADRQTRLNLALADSGSGVTDAPLARWILPDRLAETSGLALTADDRLFTHGDELGTIYEIDYRRGLVVKEFSLGSPVVHDDFEAITVVRDTLILLTAGGVLYRFTEGNNLATVPYTRLDTGLGTRCEFEGMTFDPAANVLVLACKNVKDKGLEDSMVLLRWPLGQDSTGTVEPESHLAIPLVEVIGTHGWKKIEPSDLAIDPRTGNYVIVASGQLALVEVTAGGEVVVSRSLPPGHAQPEGIAITRDNLLLVSDEAKTGSAAITIYRRQ